MDLNWPKTGHWVLTIQGLHVYCKQNRKQLQNKNNVIWRSLGEKPGGSGLRDMDPSPLHTHIHTHTLLAQCRGGQRLSWRGGCTQLGQRAGADFSRSIETRLIHAEEAEATRESGHDIWLRCSHPVTCTEHLALTQDSWSLCIPPTLRTLKACLNLSSDMSPNVSLSYHKGAIDIRTHRRWLGIRRTGTVYMPRALVGCGQWESSATSLKALPKPPPDVPASHWMLHLSLSRA